MLGSGDWRKLSFEQIPTASNLLVMASNLGHGLWEEAIYLFICACMYIYIYIYISRYFYIGPRWQYTQTDMWTCELLNIQMASDLIITIIEPDRPSFRISLAARRAAHHRNLRKFNSKKASVRLVRLFVLGSSQVRFRTRRVFLDTCICRVSIRVPRIASWMAAISTWPWNALAFALYRRFLYYNYIIFYIYYVNVI